jgi:peptide/nickel transport system substrate-binding protein
MIRKLLICSAIIFLAIAELTAQSSKQLIGEIILKKNKRHYIDKGRDEGIAVGQKFDILFEGRQIGGGIISWTGDDISYSRIDSITFSRFLYLNPLEVNLYLEKAPKYQGGVLHLPFYRKLNLTPREIMTPDEQAVAGLVYDGLVTVDNQGQIKPDLAHSWEIHGNTYTFYLDSEAKFHSGKPVDALDVAYSFVKLARAPKLTPATSFITEIDGYEEVHFGKKNELRGIFIPNRNTIAITTKDIFVPFLKYLAGAGGYILPNMQESQTLPLPIGTGPFSFVSTGDNSITLARNNEYFGDQAVLDSIIFIRYNSRKEAALDFELGRLDLIYFDSEEDRDLLTGGDYASRKYYTSSTVFLGINCRHSYQKDYRFAKALDYLFDKASIVRVLLGNSGKACEGIIPPLVGMESSKASNSYFSPTEAKTMIKQVSSLPPSLNLIFNDSDPVLESIASYIAGQLRQLELKTTVKKATGYDLEKAADLSALDLYLFRYDTPVSDPDAFFYPLFSKKLNGQTNYLYYDNPQLERYLEGARRIEDTFARNDIYLEAERLIFEQPPLISLYNPIMTVAFRRDLAGFEPDSRAFVNFRRAYFQAEK